MDDPKSILIIDDELYLRSSLSHIFLRAGYQVKTACSAGEAVQLLSARCFDLIFLDLKMPGIGGMELLSEIRLIDPGAPVIILTACANLDTANQMFCNGARAYMIKPVDPGLILRRAKEIIEEQSDKHQDYSPLGLSR